MLRVKLLDPGARMPVFAHPGEDLGYDVFAFEDVVLAPRLTAKVRTGIAVEARHPGTGSALGLLVRDRSSMAARTSRPCSITSRAPWRPAPWADP